MAKTFIQAIFVNPPIGIARLGASPMPQDAYGWARSANPRTLGDTVVVPAWSLNVRPDDATVEPVLPEAVQLRDGERIRPVCPFFEVWAVVSERREDPRETWEEAPLTTGLLATNGVTASALRLRVDARNRKAARRADNARLVFGTFPPVTVAGDNHAVVVLRGVSPPGVPAAQRMIPPTRFIPLGSVQVLRPKAQPAAPTVWSEAGIRLDVMRFRFTPARGEFYGPPVAGRTTPPAVTPGTHDFLRASAGWLGSQLDARPRSLQVVLPDDTIDVRQQRSLGVVDDTCDARIDATLSLPGRPPLAAHANVFVGPPDFGPDRRPFLSVADEINDRVGDPAARNTALDDGARDTWVEDLFERIFETVSLFNVDRYRLRFAATLSGTRVRPAPGIAGDGLPERTRALGARDRMRNPDLGPLNRPDGERPLPLSARARERHGDLSDLNFLRDFVAQNPGRLASLVRGPFEAEGVEADDDQTMRMPPFMRNSNANPLTLAGWQHALLMQWVRRAETMAVLVRAEAAAGVPVVAAAGAPVAAAGAPVVPAAGAPAAAAPAEPTRASLPAFAAVRRAQVLARLGRLP